MKSIGEKLRTNREERGYSIEQVARDTHIAKRYLEALEEESFTTLPGESYLLGFLRNYSNYLGLDENEMVALYKNMQLQEKPSPVEELLLPKPKPLGRILLIILVVIVVLGGLLAAFFLGDSNAAEPQAIRNIQSPSADPDGEVIPFTGELMERLFSQGDRISISLDNLDQPITITISEIGDQGIKFTSQDQDFTLDTIDAALVDLNNDGEDDIRLQTKGNTGTADSSPQSVIRIDRFILLPSDAPSGMIADQDALNNTGENVDRARGTTPAIGTTTVPSRIQRPQVILEQPARSRISISAQPTGPSLIRYLTDQGVTEESYLEPGDSLQATANQWIRLWTSNAGATQLQVNNQPVRLGSTGEVTAALITWAELPNNQNQRIELVPMY
jgi:cytoskeletal protein RodZ